LNSLNGHSIISSSSSHIVRSSALIVFVRRPVLGQVKTRLAATLGDAAALRVYEHLLQHTYQLTQQLECPVYVFYADAVDELDIWQGHRFIKRAQQGDDLGQRMAHAFDTVFAAGHTQVVIIGSDCLQLTVEQVNTAFQHLQDCDAVLGPATDGGYYLLGLSQPLPALFSGIAWSTGTVAAATLAKLQQGQYAVALLPALTDVDEEKDLPETVRQQLHI
jgi:uncharacterized protein